MRHHSSTFRSRRKKQASNPIKSVSEVLDIQDYLKVKSYRNYMLFILGIATGYRAGDLIELKVREIKNALESGYFSIMEGKKLHSKNIREKNRKPRKVVIIKNLRSKLQEYIKDKNDYEYMFPSRKGGHIQVKRVTEILKEAANYFGIIKITAHSMRKTYAYRIYETNGHDLLAIKEMLGHSSIEETKVYLGLDREVFDNYSETLNDLIH
ncbi:tyrosine-type recombinase/integrase [Clostridium sp. BJN0001]|uniref:tyrosine-type recombinase/integrase n=1 Tax=Clostridium sp. BJN0001 TaxID=2930219 RepID=UPI001FD21970|nr:tyrosine-type recombinase/integrase [Clostridium sp. BJN0001]